MATQIDLTLEIWHVCFNNLTLNLIEEINRKLQTETDPWLTLISTHGTTEQLFHRVVVAMDTVHYKEGWSEIHARVSSMHQEIQYCLNRFAFVAGRMENPVYALPLKVAERSSFFKDEDPEKFTGTSEEVDRILLKYLRMGDYL